MINKCHKYGVHTRTASELEEVGVRYKRMFLPIHGCLYDSQSQSICAICPSVTFLHTKGPEVAWYQKSVLSCHPKEVISTCRVFVTSLLFDVSLVENCNMITFLDFDKLEAFYYIFLASPFCFGPVCLFSLK